MELSSYGEKLGNNMFMVSLSLDTAEKTIPSTGPVNIYKCEMLELQRILIVEDRKRFLK